MRPLLVLPLSMLIVSTALARNLFENSGFDDQTQPPGVVAGKKGTYRCSYYKDADGNNCVRLQLVKFFETKEGKQVSISLYTRNPDGTPGMPVKPDTRYKFSLMLKGTGKTGVRLYEIDTAAKGKSSTTRRDLNYELTVPKKVEKTKWNRMEGFFTTGPKAKYVEFRIYFWWNEKWGPMGKKFKPGDYVLIDNIVVEKSPDALTRLSPQNRRDEEASATKTKRILQVGQCDSVPEIDGRLDDACWGNIPTQSGFFVLGKKEAANVQTEFKVFRNKDTMYVGVKCHEPNISGLNSPVTRNGLGIWGDDVVEVFFSPAHETPLMQFVVSSGGGRYMGDGQRECNVLYDRWEAKSHKDKECWTAEFKIPWTLFWDKINPDSMEMGMNVARQRRQSGELSSWAPVEKSFLHSPEYGVLFFGNGAKWIKARIGALKKEISALPKDQQPILRKRLDALDTKNLGVFFNQVSALQRQIKFAKVGKRKFVVSEVLRHRALRTPFVPQHLDSPPDKITVTAAVNEIVSVPYALTNLTDKSAEYQILLRTAKPKYRADDPILTGKAGDFPKEKFTALRAIEVKESDQAETKTRLDPLVEFNHSSTISAPSRQSGVFYYKFDCRDVKPGTYKGFMHVIPLSEPSLQKKGSKKLPQIQIIPFELTVLPIELPKHLRRPIFFYGNAQHEDLFRQLAENAITYLPANMWSMSAEFDDQGNIVKDRLENFVNHFRMRREWVRKHNPEIKNLTCVVIFSIYDNFMRRFGKDRFKVDTPEWKNAYQNYVKLFVKARQRLGLSPDEFIVELDDEPAHSPASLSIEMLAKVGNLIKEAAPDLRLFVTFSARTKLEDLTRYKHDLMSCVDNWNFSGNLLERQGYDKLLKELRKNKKRIWTYRCNTGINSELYSYYRILPWRGENYKLDVDAMWCLNHRPSFYWRNAATGCVYYLIDDKALSTVRMEALLLGFTDLRYYDKLEKVTQKARAVGKNPNVIQQAEKLLQEAPEQIYRRHNDFRLADEFRKEAIKLILQLQSQKPK